MKSESEDTNMIGKINNKKIYKKQALCLLNIVHNLHCKTHKQDLLQFEQFIFFALNKLVENVLNCPAVADF